MPFCLSDLINYTRLVCTLVYPPDTEIKQGKLENMLHPEIKTYCYSKFLRKTFYVCILCKYLADFNMHDVDSAQGCTVGSNI